MKAMFPHHSIAVMTSERANLSAPRAQKLGDEIIGAQNREIAEMRWLIDRIESGNTPADPAVGHEEGPPEIASLRDALASPVIAELDLDPMKPDDIDRVVGDAACTFSRSLTADPVLAVAPDGQAVTANGPAGRTEGRGDPGERRRHRRDRWNDPDRYPPRTRRTWRRWCSISRPNPP